MFFAAKRQNIFKNIQIILTTTQLVFSESTQLFSPQTHGECTQGFIPQSGCTAMEETRDPVQVAITCQEVRVKVPEGISDDFHWSCSNFNDIITWPPQTIFGIHNFI